MKSGIQESVVSTGVDSKGNRTTTFKDDPSGKVKLFESENGNYKHTEYKNRADGVQSVSEYKGREDGAVRYTYNRDGSGHYQYEDGTIKRHGGQGDDSEMTIDAKGNRTTTFKDDPSGKVKQYESGSGNYKHTEYKNHADGVRSVSEYKGREDGVIRYAYNRDGSGEYRYEDGTIKKHGAKGTDSETTIDAKGNKTTRYENDSFGKVQQFESANGDYKHTEYQRRADGVQSVREYKGRADGAVRYTYNHDGSGEYRYEDGTIKKHGGKGDDGATTIDAKGNKTTDYANDPSGKVQQYESASGNYKRTEYKNRADGVLSVSEYKGRADGAVRYTNNVDGSGEYRYEDGTIKKHGGKGDGNETTIDANGNKTTNYENDSSGKVQQYESASGNYKRTEYKNRTDAVRSVSEYKGREDGVVRYTYNQDGSGEYRYEDGTIKRHGAKGTDSETTIDAKGNKSTRYENDPFGRVQQYESPSGNFKVTEYKDRSDGVRSVSEYKGRADGAVSYTYNHDGSGEYRYEDGTIKRHGAKGTDRGTQADSGTRPLARRRR